MRYFERMLLALIEKGLGISLFGGVVTDFPAIQIGFWKKKDHDFRNSLSLKLSIS